MWNIKYCAIIYMLISLDNWRKVIILTMLSWNLSDCRYTYYDKCPSFVLLCHACVRGSNVLHDRCFVLFKGVAYARSLNWHSVGGFVDGRFNSMRFKVGKQLFGHSFILIIPFLRIVSGARSGVMVKALRYKRAGRGFDSRWCHWNFSVT